MPAQPASQAGLHRSLAALAGVVLLSGCATVPLDAARRDFYNGQLDQAEAHLAEVDPQGKDRALVLMERGTIRQARGDFEASSADFIAAQDMVQAFETYSLSKGATSLVINDSVMNFAGAPYERTLLHAMTALNHLSIGHWDNAAVEARRMIQKFGPFAEAEFPEDAFTRYVAGFSLEMIDDFSNAAIQYRKADELAPHLLIDEAGRIAPAPISTNQTETATALLPRPDHELVCFVLLDRSPREDTYLRGGGFLAGNVYAELYTTEGGYLGRSYGLADTYDLAYRTQQRLATLKAAKTAGRIVLKEVIASAAEHSTDSQVLGDLIRFILIGLLEQPDTRRWETLPQRLHVARVQAPPDIGQFRLTVNSFGGRSYSIRKPIQRRAHVTVSVFRDAWQLPQPDPLTPARVPLPALDAGPMTAP